MRKHHIEIVGAGLAGLTAAAVLGQRGHSVRVHEQGPELREIGAGLYLKQNSLEVLRDLGLLAEFAKDAVRLHTGEIRDERNRLVFRRVLEGNQAFLVLRGRLHELLAQCARAAGVEIVTGSTVTGATPDGEVLLAGGRRLKADLVIGADGVNSNVRESIGLTRRRVALPDGATRLLIPRDASDTLGTSVENWSGPLRVGVAPCSAEDVYVFLISPEHDARAIRVPVDHEFWIRHFPHLEGVIRRISPDAGRHRCLELVTVTAWSKGRVALLGDAAHAQPPNLGQGAGMSLANAAALGRALDAAPDIHEALRNWEAERRPISEMVQRWSHWYGKIAYSWPAWAYWARPAMLRGLLHTGSIGRTYGFLWRGGIDPAALQIPSTAK